MDPALVAFVQAGGVLAFAGLVWFELRTQRKTLERIARWIYAEREIERQRRADTGPIAIPRTLSEDDITPPGGRRSHRDT